MSSNSDFEALFSYTLPLSCALKHRDAHTQLHSARVNLLAKALGRSCALSEREMLVLTIGAFLHDVGKIGIPDEILRKPGRLDCNELEIMRTHSDKGWEIARMLPLDDAERIAEVVRHHHEYFDGTGYPTRIAGAEIPVQSRIISIVDSYDSMAETRPYRPARKHAEIMDVLHRESGIKHDPDLLKLFTKLIESSEFKAR